MRKFIVLLVIVFAANTSFAQDCTLAKKKDKFELVDGLIQATLYHDNGVVSQTGFYTSENELHGEWISYDTTGNKTAIAQYDRGSKVGTWYFFQGDTKKEVTYTDSKISEVKTWKKQDSRLVSY